MKIVLNALPCCVSFYTITLSHPFPVNFPYVSLEFNVNLTTFIPQLHQLLDVLFYVLGVGGVISIVTFLKPA